MATHRSHYVVVEITVSEAVSERRATKMLDTVLSCSDLMDGARKVYASPTSPHLLIKQCKEFSKVLRAKGVKS